MLGESTGILFTNQVADTRSITNRNLLSGSGVAAGDIDGDGLPDLYFCGLDNDNVLYRNLGNWKFQDITASAGVACPNTDATGAVFSDVDGDGDLDLLVNTLGQGTRLFLNDGKGHFTEATKEAGLASTHGSMSMALADVDGDGDLDLYVANFRPNSTKDIPNTQFRVQYIGGKPVITHVNGQPADTPDMTNRFVLGASGTVLELGEADVLYRNDGKGKFTPVSFTDGTFLDEDGQALKEPPFDWGLAVQFYDFNGDGAPDIYVCNDLFTPDRIWLNDGHGKFRAIPRLALRNTSTFSMGVDFADINHDGFVDFFVVDMLSRSHAKRQVQVGEMSPIFSPPGLIDNRPQIAQNTLQLNRGDGTFAEISRYAGVEASEWSWGPIFVDLDLDGWEDIIVSNGQLRDFQNADISAEVDRIKAAKKLSHTEILRLFTMFPGLQSHKVVFRNRHDLTFEEVGQQYGFTTAEISQGMALVDLDNDGDLDLVINNLKEGAGIYRNECSAPRVAVRLNGASPNTRGVGAKIKLIGGPVEQFQEMLSGGRYLSSDDPMRVFAAGTNSGAMRLEVTWRNGKISRIEGVHPNRVYEIDEAGAITASEKTVEHGTNVLFEEVSTLIGHTHSEEPYEDFQRQPLLPMRLSQLGPGVSWHDYDGDGFDDLAIGSGRGGKFSVYHNDGKGRFTPVAEQILQRTVARDQSTVLGIDASFIAGSANWEDGMTNGGWARIYDLGRKAAGEILLGPEASTGPMAMADVDGDARLDLFVGGRAIAGRYPEPARSLLLHNEGGRFLLKQRFDKLGLVSGAVFSDIDNDGDPDLILACHWGPLRVFQNDHGTFTEVTKQLGLEDYKGLWNGVATGDFDGDGRLDIVASNWGLNTRFAASKDYPLKIYYGNFGGNGFTDLVEARFDPLLKKEVGERNMRMVGMAFPFVHEKLKTFDAYSKSSVQEIYGDTLKQFVEVNTLASMLFLNRGGKFEPHLLPPEAQFSPAFGLCVGDLDGDGNEDLFLSQNFFATNPEMVRSDAGRGLMLKGDGKGNLDPVPGQASGIQVYGEQRGCALSDYDQDGRVDLVVTQNAAATKLYHNRGAKPGLRVRFAGESGNSSMIGAKVRLQFADHLGSVRELQGGSGYWSQNSPVQVLGYATFPKAVIVQLPNGKVYTNAIPTAAKEITITPEGGLR